MGLQEHENAKKPKKTTPPPKNKEDGRGAVLKGAREGLTTHLIEALRSPEEVFC